MNALLMDNLQGVRQIKAFSREEHEDGRFAQRADDLRIGTLGIMRVWAAYAPAMAFAGALTAFATSVAVPTYGERSSGEPVSAYEPRASRSVIVGAPVSWRPVPGAGSCEATSFVA